MNTKMVTFLIATLFVAFASTAQINFSTIEHEEPRSSSGSSAVTMEPHVPSDEDHEEPDKDQEEDEEEVEEGIEQDVEYEKQEGATEDDKKQDLSQDQEGALSDDDEEEEEEEDEEEEENALGRGHEEDNDGEEHEDHKEEHKGKHHWRYHGAYGPSNWSSIFVDCEGHGRQQSPINIELDKTKFNEMLMEVSLVINHVPDDSVTMVNNGHSVAFAYNQTTIRLTDGGYAHTYRMVGVHFHWGRDDSKGSEHLIHGKHFPLEMHIVTYDEDNYDSVVEAAVKPDGLAVLGTVFEISEEDNEELEPIVFHLKDIRVPGNPVSIQYFDLETLLPSNLKNYYRYRGSLTTPPCSESVIWTVFDTKQTISSAQLAEFRSLYEEVHINGSSELLHNWRPVQPIGKRIVYRSFPGTFDPIETSFKWPDDDDNEKEIPDQSDDRRNRASPMTSKEFYIGSILLVVVGRIWTLINQSL